MDACHARTRHSRGGPPPPLPRSAACRWRTSCQSWARSSSAAPPWSRTRPPCPSGSSLGAQSSEHASVPRPRSLRTANQPAATGCAPRPCLHREAATAVAAPRLPARCWRSHRRCIRTQAAATRPFAPPLRRPPLPPPRSHAAEGWGCYGRREFAACQARRLRPPLASPTAAPAAGSAASARPSGGSGHRAGAERGGDPTARGGAMGNTWARSALAHRLRPACRPHTALAPCPARRKYARHRPCQRCCSYPASRSAEGHCHARAPAACSTQCVRGAYTCQSRRA
mmetsp:Transcript_30781/g.91490  ORF Transcript_30781/g.91490 Transcript_30781/m.91490 type:complete len:284 (-) Transcript_30781:2359-3210(-)